MKNSSGLTVFPLSDGISQDIPSIIPAWERASISSSLLPDPIVVLLYCGLTSTVNI